MVLVLEQVSVTGAGALAAAAQEQVQEQKGTESQMNNSPRRVIQVTNVNPIPSNSVLDAIKPRADATKTCVTTINPQPPSNRVGEVLSKVVNILDKPRQAVDKALGSVEQKLESKMVQEEEQGHTGKAFLAALGASAVAFARGAATAVTSVVSPKAWVDTAKSLMHPKELVESIKSNPLEISELAGGIVGGALLGRLVAPSRPAVYETVPERTTLDIMLKQPDTIIVRQTTTGSLVKIGRSVSEAQPYTIEASRDIVTGDWRLHVGFAGPRAKLPSGSVVKVPDALVGSEVRAGGTAGSVDLLRVSRIKPQGNSFVETDIMMIKTSPSKLFELYKQLREAARIGKLQQRVNEVENLLRTRGSRPTVSKDVLDVEPKPPRVIRVPERPSPSNEPAPSAVPKPKPSATTVLEQLHRALENYCPRTRTIVLEEKPQAQLAGLSGGVLGAGSQLRVNINPEKLLSARGRGLTGSITGGKHLPINWHGPKPIESMFSRSKDLTGQLDRLGSGGKHLPVNWQEPKPLESVFNTINNKIKTGSTPRAGGKHLPISWHEPKPLEDLLPKQQESPPQPAPQPVPIVKVVPKPVVRPMPKTRVKPEPKEEPKPKPPIPVPPQPIPVPVVTPKPVVTVTPKPKPVEESKQDTGGAPSPPPRLVVDWGFRIKPLGLAGNPYPFYIVRERSRYLYKEILYPIFSPFKAIR